MVELALGLGCVLDWFLRLNFHISKDSADIFGGSFEMKERFPKLCGHVHVGRKSSV